MAACGSKMNRFVNECSVCLDSMLSKEPRLLTCGHTFCTPCIKELAAKEPLTCPKCRKVTVITDGGIQQLPKNFEYITMCEAMESVAFDCKSPENDKLCGTCVLDGRKVLATHFCEHCLHKLICKGCVDKHSRIPPMKTHKIHVIDRDCETLSSKVCPRHRRPIEYFCTKCKEDVCLYCIHKKDHNGHENEITDFQSGMKTIRKNIRHTLTKYRSSIRITLDRMNEDSEMMEITSEKLNMLELVLKNKLQEVKSYKKTLDNVQENLRHTICEVTDLKETSKVLTEQLDNLDELESHEDLQQVKKLRDKADDLTKKMKKVNDYTVLRYVPGDLHSTVNVGKLETVTHPVRKDLSLDKPELVKVIKSDGKVKLSQPSEILPVGDGTVIVVCQGLNSLQNIDINGKVVKEYRTAEKVQSATLNDDGYLYVAVDGNKIQQISVDDSDLTETYQPDSGCLSRTAASENGILITEHKSQGNVLEFDPVTRLTKVRAPDMILPWFISSQRIDGEYIYAVTERGARRVNVYSKDWKIERRINGRGGKQLINPHGNGITPGGKILVADCSGHTISEYDKDGTYIRDLLSHPDIHNPSGILYDPPYLWVAQLYPHQIKLFRVD